MEENWETYTKKFKFLTCNLLQKKIKKKFPLKIVFLNPNYNRK